MFVDIGNLYSSVSKRFDGKKINYTFLKETFSELYNIQRAFAYGLDANENTKKFITALKICGYETKFRQPRFFEDKETGSRDYKRTSFDVEIAMDVARVFEKNDVIILSTSNADIAPLASFITEKGLECVVIACGISKALRAAATRCIEIDESFLESPVGNLDVVEAATE